jgi:hypothetical protein
MRVLPKLCYYLLSHQNSHRDQFNQTAKLYVLLNITAEVPQHNVQLVVPQCLAHHYQYFKRNAASIFMVEE